MSVIEIRRLEESEEETLSAVMTNGKILGFGLELPDKDNRPNISRVPAGVYPYTKFYSPRLRQETLLLHGVPGRSGIEIHVGNTRLDISGCIVVGLSVGSLNSVRAVLSSTPAMRDLLNRVEPTGSVFIFDIPKGAT